MALPQFIIGGAPKCGTSALWKNLNEHPDISLSNLKEPTFFTEFENEINKDIVRPGPARIPTYKRGISWYENLFHSESSKVIGEASTIYMSMPDSPKLIHSVIPDVKLIFVVRDPVKRMYSHYWQDYKVGISLKDFTAMVKSKDKGFNYYKYVSQYGIHLERYRKVFEPQQIKVIVFEDLKKSTDVVYRDIFQYLDVDNDFSLTESKKRVNRHSEPRVRLLSKLVWDLRGLKLAQELPEGIRKRLGKIASTVTKINSAPSEYPELSDDLYAELHQHFVADIEYMEEYLGRSLDCWRGN